MKRSIAIEAPGDLRVDQRQLVLIQGGKEISRAPLEDLGLIVVDNAETRWTAALLAECGEYGIALVICGSKHLPSTMCLPFVGNVLMSKTWRLQIEASRPCQKRLWQAIVRGKIANQARLLGVHAGDSSSLTSLIGQVRSGDPDNIEGVAAARYFTRLFGPEFVRTRGTHGRTVDERELLMGNDHKFMAINSRLNYGYAVLRAMVARAIVLAGMHPTLGIWHRNQFNPYALADDFMEPMRPMVDEVVLESLQEFPNEEELTPPVKRALLRILTREVGWEDGQSTLDVVLERFCAQCRDHLIGVREGVSCPIV